jgi:long-chain acyl-CoA synthetase
VQGVLKTVEPERKAAFDQAHALMLEATELRMAGKEVPDDLAERVAEADRTVLAPIRGLLGLDRLERASSGAAPISVDTLRFLHGLGIKVMEIWGMSETAGAATVCEISIRGPLVLMGYLQPDGSLDNPLDEDGWLATGDVGSFDAEGFLTITDRKKELLITSSGKNIPPTLIESHLTAHPMIGFAAAIGDNRPYITALIVLDPDVVPEGTADSAEVLAAVEQAVAEANGKLSRIEQVKKFRILPGTWTPDSGEVTPKLSLRRRVIVDRYAEVIEELYREPAEESAQ